MSHARLDPLEVASGVVLGTDPSVPPVPPARHDDPRAALERRLLELLSAGPCVFALSGGRDSSALLALGAEIARREGLEPPTAVSMTFPRFPASDETAWQSALVERLRLGDWRRLEIDDEIDLLGPVARSALRRHGLLFPPNSHIHVPLLAAAPGATLISGVGGDEVFEWRWMRLAEIARLKARPRPSDLPLLAMFIAPRPLARLARARTTRRPVWWLTSRARSRVRRELAAWVASEPRRFPARLDRLHRSRYLHLARGSLERLAKDAGAGIALPLAEPDFMAALAQRGGALGPGSRERVWNELFSDLLPKELLRRPFKADYTPVLIGPHTRAFVSAWAGEAADPALVDVAALKAGFEDPGSRGVPGLLLQALWLAAGRTGSFAQSDFDYGGATR